MGPEPGRKPPFCPLKRHEPIFWQNGLALLSRNTGLTQNTYQGRKKGRGGPLASLVPYLSMAPSLSPSLARSIYSPYSSLAPFHLSHGLVGPINLQVRISFFHGEQ